MAMPNTKPACVLVSFDLVGVTMRPNDIVFVDDKTLKAHEGLLDGSPEAVKAALAGGGRECCWPPLDSLDSSVL